MATILVLKTFSSLAYGMWPGAMHTNHQYRLKIMQPRITGSIERGLFHPHSSWGWWRGEGRERQKVEICPPPLSGDPGCRWRLLVSREGGRADFQCLTEWRRWTGPWWLHWEGQKWAQWQTRPWRYFWTVASPLPSWSASNQQPPLTQPESKQTNKNKKINTHSTSSFIQIASV